MTELLLAPDDVALLDPTDTEDSTGWELPPTGILWQGRGNLQPYPGLVSARAADQGGGGPYDPTFTSLATLYLPPDAPVAEGITADVRGRQYVLSQVRFLRDPQGLGVLDCWAATASSVDQWE